MIQRSRRSLAASLLAIVAIVGTFVVAVAAPASATSNIPTQFIAKVYTEGLGRAPDPSGYTNAVNFFSANGCTAATLKSFVSQTLNDAAGTEFGNIGYNKSEKAIVLFRSMLNRDPDTTGFVAYRDYLATNNMAAAVNSIGGGSEFVNLANTICSATPDYDWGTTLPSPTPDSGTPGAAKTNVDLQNALNANAGGQVLLNPRDVYILNAPVNIPANTKLYTFFGPPPTGYAKLAHLVVSPFMAFNSSTRAAITLQPGAQISNVWIDGGRTFRSDCRSNAPGGVRSPVPVETLAGPDAQATQVTNSKIGNTCGGTSVSVLDVGVGVPTSDATGKPCTTANPTVVSGNLIESYSSEHDNSARQADGLSVHCRATTVTNNSIIDPTDGGIVLFSWNSFGPATSPGQQSQVTSNKILSLGQGAWYGLAADALYVANPSQSLSGDAPNTPGVSFVGAHMDSNTLWTASTGPTSGAGSAGGHMDTVLSVGTHVLFGSRTGTAAMSGSNYVAGRNGYGIVMNNNTSAGMVTRVQVAFVVSGMLNATVTGNNFPAIQMVVSGPCNSGHAVVHTTSAGYASVNFAGLASWDDTTLSTDHCIDSLT